MLLHIFRVLRREPAVAITIVYLFVAMAGIFYNYTFYKKFGIPVLTLSQVSDFLVAGIQQPMALLLVLSTLPIIWVFDRINVYSRGRRIARREAIMRSSDSPARKTVKLWFQKSPPRWFTATAYALGIVGYGWSFVQVYADHRADSVKHGDAKQVSIWLTGSDEPLTSHSKGWTYLGAVSSYVFIYDQDSAQSQILPVNAVARIQPAMPTKDETRSPVIIAPIP